MDTDEHRWKRMICESEVFIHNEDCFVHRWTQINTDRKRIEETIEKFEQELWVMRGERCPVLLDGRDSLPSTDLTEKIIGCAFRVANTLGPGFLEKVYENALAHEIRRLGLEVQQQKRVDVFYDGLNVGYFDADVVVEGEVIVEVRLFERLKRLIRLKLLTT